MLPLAPRGVRSPERRLAFLMGARAIMQSILERLLLTYEAITKVRLSTRGKRPDDGDT